LVKLNFSLEVSELTMTSPTREQLLTLLKQ